MATARERLLQAMAAIVAQPYNDDGLAALTRLLNSYRVQAKPGEELLKDRTARDTLAAMLVSSWKQRSILDKDHLVKLSSPFRMQLKLTSSRRHGRNKISSQIEQDNTDSHKTMTRSQIKENTAKHENAYFRKKTQDGKEQHLEDYAVAGGPIQKAHNRGQCPKCRSMGIVLARAYGGESYYSCIYCGHHAYLKDCDPNLDLPLAAELLGKNLGYTKIDDED